MNSLYDELALDNTQKVLLEFIRSDPSDGLRAPFAAEAYVDYNLPKFWQPYLYLKLSRNPLLIGKHRLEELKEAYLYNIAKNEYFCHGAAAVSEALNSINISPIFFKGLSLINTVYRNEATRVLADIDFCVEKKDVPRAQAAILGMGYKIERQGKDLHHAYSKNDFCIELHWKIGLGSRAKTLKKLFETRRQIDVAGKKLGALSPAGELFAVCMNFDSTFFPFPCPHIDKDTSLYRGFFFLYDIKQIVNFYGSEFKWAEFLSLAETDKRRFDIFTLISLAEKIVKAKIPGEIMKKLEKPFFARFYLYLIRNISYEECFKLFALREILRRILISPSLIFRPNRFIANLKVILLTYLYIYKRDPFWHLINFTEAL